MKKLTAVIITGNPKHIANNEKADAFYKKIKDFLESLNYEVSLDPGLPYTSPKDANLWIGHSRGSDRLTFDNTTPKSLAFGAPIPQSINHPDDNVKTFAKQADYVPNEFHYVFTQEMKDAILKVTEEIRSGIL